MQTSEAARPFLRPVSADEAAKLSPWPDRIAGRTPWSRPARSDADLDREYDQALYGELPQHWASFNAGLPRAQRHIGAVVRFLNAVRRDSDRVALESKPAGDMDRYTGLVSAGDRLYAADIAMVELLLRGLVIERVVRACTRRPVEAVLEIGCGTGVNLFNLLLHLPLVRVVGQDRSANAITFLKNAASDAGVAGTFEFGDFRDPKHLASIAPAKGSWALLSVHAIQMVESVGAEWLEAFARLRNPPSVAVQIEPVVWPEADGVFAAQCVQYAVLNHYNFDYLDDLRAAESAGAIEVLGIEPRVLGTSAFSPSSVLVWAPRHR